MDNKPLIVCAIHWVVAFVKPTFAEPTVKPSALFGKEEKLDKLIIKNQIAYHFKKVVREVKEELFVSRRIDVSRLFAGINILQKTETQVRKLCDSLPATGPVMAIVQQPVEAVAKAPVIETRVVHVDQQGRSLSMEPFTLVPGADASFKEAKARCAALGMQLPEIYSINQQSKLVDFLNVNNIAQCFAGIEPDLSDSIPRHISTQYPIWKTAYDRFFECGGTRSQTDLGWTMDDGHAKFLYTSDGKLCVSRDVEGNPIFDGHYASTQYREKNKILSQLMSRIVCAPKWDGMTDLNPPVDNLSRGHITVKARYSRSIKAQRLRRSKSNSVIANMHNVKALCLGVADHAKETHEEIQLKMVDLLALVDITLQERLMDDTNRQRRELHRQKRVIPLYVMKFIFVTGAKLLWQLFGFVQKVKMDKRLKNIESMLQINADRSGQNSNAITKMTRLIEGNSVAISQLSIRVDGLEHRLTQVEDQVKTLQEGVEGLVYKFELVTALVTIDNLVVRTRGSMDTGYDILKDIIHNSVQKQTSPLILPLDQMELVQTEVSKSSTALLDPDFAKMQSIVVSDPNDPTKLLVVVNLAALDRKDLELVNLVPVPYFENGEAYEISLDYRYLVLDQSAHTFSILTEQEENDCLFNRCYIASPEQSLLEKSCGIPQFYDQHKDNCVSELIQSNGVFLKPMLPDGVIFALKGKVRSEVFCLGKPIGSPSNLRGTGILQLPNGCILQVIDDEGRVFKVKGLPQHTLLNAGDYNLIEGGPLSALHTEIDTNNTKKVSTVNAFVESRVSSVIKQVEIVDDKMFEQHRHVWILTGTISLTILLIVIAILLLYRFSTRARRKIRDIRGNFSELTRKVLEPEIGNPAITNLEIIEGRERLAPPPPQRKRDVWLRHLRERRQISRTLRDVEERQQGTPTVFDNDNMVPSMKNLTYMNLSEIDRDEEEMRYISLPLSRQSSFRPIPYPGPYRREYPSITPLMRESRLTEDDRIKEETELTEKLCSTFSPRPPREKRTNSDV